MYKPMVIGERRLSGFGTKIKNALQMVNNAKYQISEWFTSGIIKNLMYLGAKQYGTA